MSQQPTDAPAADPVLARKISTAWIKMCLDSLGDLCSVTMHDGVDVGETAEYRNIERFLRQLLQDGDLSVAPKPEPGAYSDEGEDNQEGKECESTD